LYVTAQALEGFGAAERAVRIPSFVVGSVVDIEVVLCYFIGGMMA
jgi:hypothetical protein